MTDKGRKKIRNSMDDVVSARMALLKANVDHSDEVWSIIESSLRIAYLSGGADALDEAQELFPHGKLQTQDHSR